MWARIWATSTDSLLSAGLRTESFFWERSEKIFECAILIFREFNRKLNDNAGNTFHQANRKLIKTFLIITESWWNHGKIEKSSFDIELTWSLLQNNIFLFHWKIHDTNVDLVVNCFCAIICCVASRVHRNLSTAASPNFQVWKRKILQNFYIKWLRNRCEFSTQQQHSHFSYLHCENS